MHDAMTIHQSCPQCKLRTRNPFVQQTSCCAYTLNYGLIYVCCFIKPSRLPEFMTNAHSPAETSANASMSMLQILRSPQLMVRECLAGVITALALIPEVISFSVIAGVDPKVSLFASVVLCLMMSIIGGRPAMVTAAAGAVALVIGPMVKTYGVEYILPAVLLAGVIQIVFGLAGLSRMLRYVPRSVMIGFVNALAILIFCAQIPHLIGHSPLVWVLFAATVAIVFLLPKLNKSIPSALVAIVVLTAISMIAALQVPTVGGDKPMEAGLPTFTQWLVPLDWSTLSIIWPTAISVAFVGLLESLLTAKLVDDMTDSNSSKTRESWALGISNICAGWYGGIAGCAMIGQTMVNVQLGKGRSRISTIVAALVLLLLVTSLSSVMSQIPMVVLAGIMMIVALKTVNWHSIQPATLKRMPWSETIVMVVTVIATVTTANLAIGVAGGVVLAMVLFARRVAHVIHVHREVSPDTRSVRYVVRGPLFFASSNDLVTYFEYATDPKNVYVDLTHAQVWDASTVAALDAIEEKYRRYGAKVSLIGLDERSLAMHDKLRGNL
jgi:SulP family sulfate permease